MTDHPAGAQAPDLSTTSTAGSAEPGTPAPAAAGQPGATSLSLAGLGLTSLPEYLADLAGTLLELDLSDNLIEHLPDWLGRFDQLRTLDLSRNHLATVPPSIKGLSRLTRLGLADNRLIELPAELGALRQLNHLDVSGNRHLMVPPPEIAAQGGQAVLTFLRDLSGTPPEPAGPSSSEAQGPAGKAGTDSAAEPAAADSGPAWLNRWTIAGFSITGLVAVALFLSGGAQNGSRISPAAAAGPTATRLPRPSSASDPGLPAAAAVLTPSASPSASASPTPPPTTQPAAPRPGGSTQAAPRTVATHAAPPKPPKPKPKPTAPPEPTNVDFALGGSASATSYTQNYVPADIDDGNTSTYWESAPNAFPQQLRLKLRSAETIAKMVLSLPPVSDWNSRTQTITISGSVGGGSQFTIRGQAGYQFNAATGDTVTITFPAVRVDTIDLDFTANSGWYAAQLSEIAVYG
jgi:Leucine-rich repeat (LRR) protein